MIFIGLTMFVSIINGNFREIRRNNIEDEDSEMLNLIWDQFLQTIRIRKVDQTDSFEDRDKRMRHVYFDPIEHFVDQIDWHQN